MLFYFLFQPKIGEHPIFTAPQPFVALISQSEDGPDDWYVSDLSIVRAGVVGPSLPEIGPVSSSLYHAILAWLLEVKRHEISDGWAIHNRAGRIA